MAFERKKCKQCKAGTHSLKANDADAGANQCVPCARGQATSTAGTADKCPACIDGTYSDVKGGTECKVCQPGTRTVDRMSACADCLPGKQEE